MVNPPGHRKWLAMPAVQLLLFCLGSLLIYWPNLGRSFASDDFEVMKRVGMDKVIWIKGFFRPLSDITLYLNYLVSGFRPAGYYATNILLHGIGSYLFYLFCLRWKWTEDRRLQERYALIAALLFLCYPFHSESIVWVLGRASLVANVFGMGTLLAVVSKGPLAGRVAIGSLCYFLGMAGYESVLLLPVMVLVILWGKPKAEYAGWMGALGLALLVHLALRVLVSGAVAGAYGDKFLGSRLMVFAGNLLRTAGRLFLPPIQSTGLFVAMFVVVFAAIAFAVWVFLRRRREERGYLIRLVLLLAVACGVPCLSGVSIHTTESDRFLYFPSYFICAGVALLLVRNVRWVAVLLIYELIFVVRVNINWGRASGLTKEVLAAIARQGDKKVFVVDLPDEIDGAYVFRLGLPEALLMMGRDTSKVVIVSHLTRDEALLLPDTLGVPPIPVGAGRGDVMVYWNKKVLHLFILR